MVMMRDFLNPILKNVPYSTRPPKTMGAFLVAIIAAINPVSYFTRPYMGAVMWLILSWWFYKRNPYNMVRNPDRPASMEWWRQVLKALSWGMLFNFVPMFFIYSFILIVARLHAKDII